MAKGSGKGRHRASPYARTSGRLAAARAAAEAQAQTKSKPKGRSKPKAKGLPPKPPGSKDAGAIDMPAQPGPNPMMPLMMMLIMLMVITSPGLREGMGLAAGGVLEPSIGMDGELILMTIWIAGLIMVFSTTLIRHFVMDWAKMAEVQQKMGAFQKEVKKARKSGNMARMQKLMKTHQPKVMSLQAEMSSNQTKPMIFTMFIALPIFMWLYDFIDGLPWRYASLPWESAWSLRSNKGTLLPHWIILYSLMSLPFGQALQRGLKLLSFSGELRKLEDGKGLESSTARVGTTPTHSEETLEGREGTDEDEPFDEDYEDEEDLDLEEDLGSMEDEMGPPPQPPTTYVDALPEEEEMEGDLGYCSLVEDDYGKLDPPADDPYSTSETEGIDPITGARRKK